MMAKPEPTVPGQHNFITKVEQLVDQGKILPGYSMVEVQHDDWCDYREGGLCNCDPDINLRTMSNNN